MASLTKAKAVYGARMKRRSLPPISTDRTGLKIQEIPPELCHLTRDALAAPFPPIALGGYMKYYKAYPGGTNSPISCIVEQTKLEIGSDESLNKMKKRRRRASSASTLLGPLLSHTPMPSPWNEEPPKSHLFHIRAQLSSDDTSSPTSPDSPLSPLSPLSRRRHLLSIIPEASRETMHAEISESISLPSTPRKPRVASYPAATKSSSSTTTASTTTTTASLSTSALTLNLSTISSPTTKRSSSLTSHVNSRTSSGTVPLSPVGSLRRKKRQILRTPSVEKDFARSARELLGLGKREISVISISRQNSSGSESVEEDGSGSSSPTITVSTALTSVQDSSSIPPSPLSPTTLGVEEGGNDRLNDCDGDDDDNLFRDTAATISDVATLCFPVESKPSPKLDPPELDGGSESDANSSPTVCTPPTRFTTGGLLDDEDLRKFVVLELVKDDDEEEGGERDSWASYATAKSCIELMPVVIEADESHHHEMMPIGDGVRTEALQTPVTVS